MYKVAILRQFFTVFLLLKASFLSAQIPEDVHYMEMDSLLIYVLPFYAVTILGLGLFIHKLMRPNFPSKWLYICTLTGILGAGVVAYQIQEVRNGQLPQQHPSEQIDVNELSPEVQKEIEAQASDNREETIANYWVVAIPNFILLFLGLGVDWRNRKDVKM